MTSVPTKIDKFATNDNRIAHLSWQVFSLYLVKRNSAYFNVELFMHGNVIFKSHGKLTIDRLWRTGLRW